MLSEIERDAIVFDLHIANYTALEVSEKYGMPVTNIAQFRNLKWYTERVSRVVHDGQLVNRFLYETAGTNVPNIVEDLFTTTTKNFFTIARIVLYRDWVLEKIEYIKGLHDLGIHDETICIHYGLSEEDLHEILDDFLERHNDRETGN